MIFIQVLKGWQPPPLGRRMDTGLPPEITLPHPDIPTCS